MRENHVLSSIQTGFKTVNIAFEANPDSASQTWTYKMPDQLDGKVGDKVVVQANKTYKVGTIMVVHAEPQISMDASYDYKWVIDKVDFTLFNAILESEKAFTETLRKMRSESTKKQIISALAEQFEGSPEDVEKAVKSLCDIGSIQTATLIESK